MTTNSSAKGIDFHQALAILSSRSEQQEESKQESCPCHAAAPGTNLPTMGQIIDLQEGTATTNDDDNNNNNTTNKSSERKQALVEMIAQMSSRQLLQAVLEAQQQRVATYRDYDRGLQAVLATNNVAYYPTACTEATAAFCVVADTLQVLQQEIQKRHDGNEYCTLLGNLQQHEQLKLQYTAALHLEQIRCHQAAEKDATRPLLEQSVASLQKKLSACVDDINEVLEEIQCALSDAANDDGAAS